MNFPEGIYIYRYGGKAQVISVDHPLILRSSPDRTMDDQEISWYSHLVIEHSHGKSPFLIGKPSISMGHLYHGYVKLPDGSISFISWSRFSHCFYEYSAVTVTVTQNFVFRCQSIDLKIGLIESRGFNQWEIFRILKWRYCTIFLAIFWGDIPLHRPEK